MEFEQPNGEIHDDDARWNRRKFTKLKRIKEARERDGESLTVDETLQLLALDNWLAHNNEGWNRNYPESEYVEELIEAIEYYQEDDSARA